MCCEKNAGIPPDQSLDEADYKWYTQLSLSGLAMRGTEIQIAEERFSKQLDVHCLLLF